MLLLKRITYLLAFCFVLSSAGAQDHFTNPLLPSGADPWVIQKDGYYYFTHTTGRNLVLYKTKSLAGLKTAQKKTVWQPPANTAYSKQIWAPELHYIDGSWYFYFAADDGSNENHRLYVLENKSADPMKGKWTLKGRIAAATDKWAIDGSVFSYRSEWYMIWSGWQGDANGEQDIYIAKMKNPWTIDGERVRISSPTLDWETHGDLHDAYNPPHVSVNEGPEALQHDDKLFIVYSASGCWTDFYGLGLLSFTGTGNLLDSAAWKKSEQPVFTGSAENGVFAPGHNSFFRSPDGREDWILYHANSAAGQGCGGHRTPRAQVFTWDSNGRPVFGAPVKPGESLLVPSADAHARKEQTATSK